MCRCYLLLILKCIYTSNINTQKCILLHVIRINVSTLYFFLAGKIESGLPRVSLPPFSAQVGNQTYTFFDMCAHYGSGIVILPLISVLANVAIAKAFGINFILNRTTDYHRYLLSHKNFAH